MRASSIILGGIAALLVAGPAVAGGKPVGVSWGKPNVSFAAYRQDTLDCANQTYGLDVSMKPETAQALGAANGAALDGFVTATGAMFSQGGRSYTDGERGYRSTMSAIEPDHAIFRNTSYTSLFNNAARADVVDQLQAVLDHCLETRGYRRFRLTDDQRHRLSGLKHGSPERLRYLFSLGSSPLVLAYQAI